MGYILVNPKLSNSTINSKKKNESEAAEEIWSQLSSNIKNYTPKFYFTIQQTGQTGGTKLSHFVVKESYENERVKYSLKEFTGKKIDNKTFLNELKQEGGKRKHRYEEDDDDSSSSSSSDEELIFTFPTGKTSNNLLSLTYYPTIYGVPNVILPTFATSFAPFVNVKLLPNVLIIK